MYFEILLSMALFSISQQIVHIKMLSMQMNQKHKNKKNDTMSSDKQRMSIRKGNLC